jgi:hypothetical protein
MSYRVVRMLDRKYLVEYSYKPFFEVKWAPCLFGMDGPPAIFADLDEAIDFAKSCASEIGRQIVWESKEEG